MLILARLTKTDGTMLGTKSVPEDCLALKYGGSTFARIGNVINIPTPQAIYQRTDTYHFQNLDQE